MRKLTLAAVVVLLAVLVAACGGSGSDAATSANVTTEGVATSPTTTSESADTEPETVTEDGATTESDPAETSDEPAETAPAPPAATVIRLKGGGPVGGPKTITVKKGDTVRLRVVSDVPDDIHVHGYDIEKPVAPGQPANFRFVAEFEGIFEVEGHEAADLIGKIVVEP